MSPIAALRRGARAAQPLVGIARNEGWGAAAERLRTSLARRLRRWRAARPTAAIEDLDPSAYTAPVEPIRSVIVAVADQADSVRAALRSVQSQAVKKWECVVVDDASLDGSLEVAQTFAAVDTRFRIVRHDEPRGSDAAWRTGLALARGAYSYLLDGADRLPDGVLAMVGDDPANGPVRPDHLVPTAELRERYGPVDDGAAPWRAVGPPSAAPSSGVEREADGAVLLVASAAYHVDELGPLHDVLAARGVKTRFMLVPQTGEAALAAIGQYTPFVLPYRPELAGRAAAVVVLNDWGGPREMIELANEAGVPTFAKVEGVQDFDDVDIGRLRQPYRWAQVILAQGEADAAALGGRTVEVVGGSRLERLWAAPPIAPGEHVLVNLNFTFGVMPGAREDWLSTIAEAVAATGSDARVSTHPAERDAEIALPITSKPFRYEITRAGTLISRFSTVPFEAMARGVPFIYHNPHDERVPTFKDPLGAFPVTASADELADAMRTVVAWRGAYRERAEKFFRRQIDIDPARPSEVRSADVICRLL